MTSEELDAFEIKIKSDLKKLMDGQQEILNGLMELRKGGANNRHADAGFIPALEYMRAIGIKRWKFNALIAGNKIRTIKKKRKIYVPIGEVERYFRDPEIQ